MSLRGQLEDLGVAEILHVVGAARRSGLLRLQSPAGRADVLFRDGTVVALRGAGMHETLAELLAAAGALDEELRTRAQAHASAHGTSLDEALAALGHASSFRAQQAIEAEIERKLPSLLPWKSGTFEFSLIAESDPASLRFGAMALESGLAVARLGAARGRRGLPPESAGETTGARRARLLIAEDRIALPGSGPGTGTIVARAITAPAPPAAAATLPPQPAPAPRGAGRTVLHCLQSGPLRQRLLAALAEASVAALAVTTWTELDAAVEAARSRGESVVLACHAGHPDLPGIELLARLRSVDAGAPAVLLMGTEWPTGRQAAVADRAQRLGARVLALLAQDGGPADEAAADLAARLLLLLQPHGAGEPPLPPQAGSDRIGLDIDAEAPPSFSRRAAPQLGVLARWLAAAGETAEIAREILAVGGEHFDACVLLVRNDGVLEPLGHATGAGGAAPPVMKTGGFPAGGADFLARAVRDGMPLDGPPPAAPADLPVLRMLGAEGAARLAVLPLLAAGTCYGVLAARTDEPADSDLSTLSTFVVEAGPALWEALSRERRRLEARRTRAGA